MQNEPERIPNKRDVFERREFIRIDKPFVLYYTDVTTERPKSDASQIKNISIGGILFVTDREFSKGTILKVRLRFPYSSDYITVKVEVINSKEKVKGLMYDTSTKFIDIKEEDKNEINKIVEHYLQDKKIKKGEQSEE